MMTTGQQQKLEQILEGKNLPLDLKSEILDHMTEQAIYKTEIEKKSFDLTLQEISHSWKAELRWSWWPFMNRRTVFERKITNRTEWTILKKSLFYWALYTILSTGLIFYDSSFANHVIFTVHLLAVSAFVLYLLIEFKLTKTILNNLRKKRLSFMQVGAHSFYTASIMISFLIMIDFDSKFERYAVALNTLAKLQSFSQTNIGSLLMYWLYDLWWIFGYLYFLQYRKAVRFLQNKIHVQL